MIVLVINFFQSSKEPSYLLQPSLSSRLPLLRSQSPTNYFSNNRESPEISTKLSLAFNLLNKVNEFKSNTFQNNTSKLVSDKSNK